MPQNIFQLDPGKVKQKIKSNLIDILFAVNEAISAFYHFPVKEYVSLNCD